jgi:hypothetical protein
MNNMRLRTFVTLLFALVLPCLTMGQDVEMADKLVSNGKIYIVVGVLSVVLAGLFIFLISIDFRLRKLERKDVK